MDDPISNALRRTVQLSHDVDDLTRRVTQSFGVGQLGRAQQIAYELKGYKWLYGAMNNPELPATLGAVDPSDGSRGWVYVLSNHAMPGLLKIGFSTKDPMDRAAELEGTGVPVAFEVEYDVLVQSPRAVEIETHNRLSHCREAKEFFRTSVNEAVGAIKAAVLQQGKQVFSEQRRTR